MAPNTSAKARSSSTGSGKRAASRWATAEKFRLSRTPASTPTSTKVACLIWVIMMFGPGSCAVSLGSLPVTSRTPNAWDQRPFLHVESRSIDPIPCCRRSLLRSRPRPRAHRLPDLLEHRFVVPVDGEIALSVVDDEQVSKAAQPVGEHHTPRCDRPHLLPRRRANEQALPRGPAAGTLGTEAVCEYTPDRQAQSALEPRQGPFRAPGLRNSFVAKERRGRDHPAELLDEPRQPGLVALEVLHLAALRAQLAGDARKHFAVLRLLFDQRAALRAPR